MNRAWQQHTNPISTCTIALVSSAGSASLYTSQQRLWWCLTGPESNVSGQHEGISRIYASPFLRTVQTAAQVASVLHMPICIENGLCEPLLNRELLCPELPFCFVASACVLEEEEVHPGPASQACMPRYADCIHIHSITSRHLSS